MLDNRLVASVGEDGRWAEMHGLHQSIVLDC